MNLFLFHRWKDCYIMSRIISHLFKSNILLALSSAVLVLSLRKNPWECIHLGIFIYSVVFFVYGIHRILKWRIKQLSDEWVLWYAKALPIMIPLLIIHLLVAIYIWISEFERIVDPYLIIIVILTMGYMLPNHKFSLRSIPKAKAFIIAAVWTYVIAIFPSQLLLDYPSEPYFFLGFFCYFLHLAILSDIKDVAIDPPRWETFPVFQGVTISKRLSFVLALLAITFFSLCEEIESGFIVGVLYLFGWMLFELVSKKKPIIYDHLLWVLGGLFVVSRLL